jgi:N-glycosylase/DNA lyase
MRARAAAAVRGCVEFSEAFRPLAAAEAPASAVLVDADLVFASGQTFSWHRVHPDTMEPLGADAAVDGSLAPTYVGVVGRVGVAVQSREGRALHYRRLVGAADVSAEETEAALRSLLRLDEDFDALVAQWGRVDEVMGEVSRALPGWRLLRQPPWECLVSFLLSSNNNVARIESLVRRVRGLGETIGEVGGVTLHAMPSPAVLAAVDEAHLRGMGLGYRARFVRDTAATVLERSSSVAAPSTAWDVVEGDAWLHSLRGQDASTVRKELLGLFGVGPKVGDCVALFALDCDGIVPVDTHIWQVAHRDGFLDPTAGPPLPATLTPRLRQAIEDAFCARFGPRCGWAHQLRFAAELARFRTRLPPPLQARILEFAKQRRGTKRPRPTDSEAE